MKATKVIVGAESGRAYAKGRRRPLPSLTLDRDSETGGMVLRRWSPGSTPAQQHVEEQFYLSLDEIGTTLVALAEEVAFAWVGDVRSAYLEGDADA